MLCPADDHPLFPAPSLGAKVFLVRGSLDDCRALERDLGGLFPWGFVGGNLYPFASEGAKTIAYETAEQLGWELPDAVVCPVGSGMLLAKIAQGFNELESLEAVSGVRPRLFVFTVHRHENSQRVGEPEKSSVRSANAQWGRTRYAEFCDGSSMSMP